jgi:hypothetical protein
LRARVNLTAAARSAPARSPGLAANRLDRACRCFSGGLRAACYLTDPRNADQADALNASVPPSRLVVSRTITVF